MNSLVFVNISMPNGCIIETFKWISIFYRFYEFLKKISKMIPPYQ
jgi:hypothetical protein